MTDEENIELAARRLCLRQTGTDGNILVIHRSLVPWKYTTPQGEVVRADLERAVPLWTFWKHQAATALGLDQHTIGTHDEPAGEAHEPPHVDGVPMDPDHEPAAVAA